MSTPSSASDGDESPTRDLDHLSPTDALSILRTLADSDEDLAARIAGIATAHLSEVDPEEVAAVLYDELDALEVEEVWDRAGSTRHGYIEPGEAADQIIEEVPGPFLEELGKHQKIGMNTEANRMYGVAAGTVPVQARVHNSRAGHPTRRASLPRR